MKEFQDCTFLYTLKNIFSCDSEKRAIPLSVFSPDSVVKEQEFLPFPICVKRPQNDLKTSHYQH